MLVPLRNYTSSDVWKFSQWKFSQNYLNLDKWNFWEFSNICHNVKHHYYLLKLSFDYYARPNVTKCQVYQFFYVNEKFTHQVIYLNTNSSIFYVNWRWKFTHHFYYWTLLSVANFFNESTYLLIKFLALISSFLYLYGVFLRRSCEGKRKLYSIQV